MIAHTHIHISKEEKNDANRLFLSRTRVRLYIGRYN